MWGYIQEQKSLKEIFITKPTPAWVTLVKPRKHTVQSVSLQVVQWVGEYLSGNSGGLN